jgi:catechol 2,3-dioxygenase-like lactoylglutathione lyase family enzyme
MDMKLELVPVPVTDVDRAKSFYVDKVGFNLDHDHQVSGYGSGHYRDGPWITEGTSGCRRGR